MINLIKNEITKIFKKKGIYITLIITLLFVLLANLLCKYGDNIANNMYSDSYRIYVETQIRKLDPNKTSDNAEYISLKTDLDIINLEEKYGKNSWQYYVLSEKIYPIIRKYNEYKYALEKNEESFKLAEEEYNNAEFDMNYYQELLVDAKRALREKEYPAASVVWYYLTETMGLNEHVAAGILGNMMAEVGGQTLDLQVDCSGRGYYGICQWSRKYMVYDITGSNLDTQLGYLNETIEDEFAVFGDIYTSGFTYQDFCNMQNAQDAAKAFAVVYERCGSGSHNVRKSNAVTAYEYYTE